MKAVHTAETIAARIREAVRNQNPQATASDACIAIRHEREAWKMADRLGLTQEVKELLREEK